GINPPEIVRQRIPEILERTGARALKIKLGSSEGIESDQAMFSVVRETTPPPISLRVDANGGWDLPDALTMVHWLAERGAEFVEQPLAWGCESDLPELFRESPIPI